MTFTRPSRTVQQAIAESSTLNNLLTRMDQSQQCLRETLKLVPLGLHSTVQAGPITDSVWCLLVNQASAMSKLKQLKPILLESLKARGLPVIDIRLKRVF